jgi:hypothetical protein
MWKGLMIACFIMLGVLGLSAVSVEPGTPTYAVIQIAAAHLVVAILIVSAFLYFDWNPVSNIFR